MNKDHLRTISQLAFTAQLKKSAKAALDDLVVETCHRLNKNGTSVKPGPINDSGPVSQINWLLENGRDLYRDIYLPVMTSSD